MSDSTYDAIVIGGGANGLITALYLQDAGMETAIFERNMEIGGGLCGDEVPVPGFTTNTCATNVRFYTTPCYEDFEIGKYGLNMVFPKAGQGIIFDDETCLVTYPTFEIADEKTGKLKRSPENVEKTLKEISRFSERDAETAADLLARIETKWHEAYREYMFSPPTPWGTKDALERLLDDPDQGIDPRWQVMTGVELAYELFESTEMRIYFMRSIQTNTGNWPDDIPGLFQLVHGIATILNTNPPSAVRGGSHAVAHALQRAFSERGGKFFVESEVDKVLVENGKATGVRLSSGAEVKARKVVVSDADPNQTLLRFIGEDQFDHKLVRKVKNIRYDRGGGMFWGSAALNELPKYKASTFNPDCDSMPRTLIAPKDPFYVAERFKLEALATGLPSKFCWFAGPDTIWDKTRAPEGKHLVQIEQYCGTVNWFSEQKWIELRREYPKELMKQWQLYAPNMTAKNVIDVYIDTAVETARRSINNVNGSIVGAMVPSQMGRFRPIPELANYRMPVQGLYLCSAATHVGLGIRGSCGYNCYKMIAEDFGLKQHWKEKGRPY